MSTRLHTGVLGETVPVADKRKIPGLIEIAIGAVPIDQPIFIIITACSDVETVTAHRSSDGFGRLVLVRVPSVCKISDRCTAEGDPRKRVVGIVRSGFTHTIIVAASRLPTTIVVGGSVDRRCNVGKLTPASLRFTGGHRQFRFCLGR
ncbi:hypothetical protein CA13_73210 [Planctomycetes bacterium CA13]|uniref:Uncharacterized protein n=1 Tax=Novipirellula herctigrandis TaxID=2527986 RepID=A0A5C5YLW6_9BACT|nr:hypothetical protein CA13_73210 [Planctomycetes bacterium CA13]